MQRLGQDTYYDTSTTNITSSSTSVTVATDATTRYEVGDIIEWWEDSTYDAAIISAVAATTLTLQTPRGAFGTTAAAHDGSTTAKRFRKVTSSDFLSINLSNYLDQGVNSLWPDVPAVQVSTYTVSTTDVWFGLPSDAETVLGAYQVTTSTPNEIKDLPLYDNAPRWAHVGFAASNKAVRVVNADSSLTSFYVISTKRPAITELTSAQQDIVVYHAARLALEAAAAKPALREDPTVFGAEVKIQLMRREEQRLRDHEHARLNAYTPALDHIRYRGR